MFYRTSPTLRLAPLSLLRLSPPRCMRYQDTIELANNSERKKLPVPSILCPDHNFWRQKITANKNNRPPAGLEKVSGLRRKRLLIFQKKPVAPIRLEILSPYSYKAGPDSNK